MHAYLSTLRMAVDLPGCWWALRLPTDTRSCKCAGVLSDAGIACGAAELPGVMGACGH